ncbi:TIGR02444 family protein [Congregibacter sp.]|uniref:TIGR02444 family protein n=1 Tax=Congregibacter sp. TaxID=2744308 RepID=UPI003F6BD58A
MDAGEQTKSQEEATARAGLWRFAVTVYGLPGVADACLRAQRQWDVDVNLMLFVSWCAGQGVCLTPDDLQRAEARCLAWRERVVLPVREQREQWRNAPGLGAEYAAIKDLELQAERRQLELLADFFEQDHASAVATESKASVESEILKQQLRVLATHYDLANDAFAEYLEALRKG